MENISESQDKKNIKRLHRSLKDRWISGVSGGIAEYFNVPSFLVRTIMLGLAIAGFGILLYFVLWIVVPLNQDQTQDNQVVEKSTSSVFYMISGIAFILLGTFQLLENMGFYFVNEFYNSFKEYAFPFFVILLGLSIIYFSFHTNSMGEKVMSENNEQKPKRLYRIMNERMIAGVCSGLGHYFNVDPVIVRILFVISIFISFGATLFVYLVLALVTPKEI